MENHVRKFEEFNSLVVFRNMAERPKKREQRKKKKPKTVYWWNGKFEYNLGTICDLYTKSNITI